ncbi:MAG: hypothetical protein ACI4SV_05115, partial [Duodenibacillus sp.]
LAHHIEVTDGKKGADAKKPAEDDMAMTEEDFKTPTLRYTFGDDKDFPLQQAKAHLLGRPVVTHTQTQAKLKAARKKNDVKAD